MIEYKNVKIFTDDIDQATIQQVYDFQKSPLFPDVPIRIMPDCHAGKGSCIGLTAKFTEKVCPSVVGVDIGCGMLVIELGNIDIDLDRLDAVVHEYIPCGRDVSRRRKEAVELIKKLYCYRDLKNLDRLEASLGTLGGGNHFIEVDKDEEGNKYLVIHSGSRNLGKQVAEIYQYAAIRERKQREKGGQELIKKMKEEGRQKEIEAALAELRAKEPSLPDDLCYVTGENAEKYLHDMRLCQEFAIMNRQIMADNIVRVMKWKSVGSFTSVHNYIGKDDIIRKGAISAYEGERVIIPLNMRDGSIIGIGKGNADWNYSAPHGAGRVLSRSEAKKLISLDEYKASMEGIYSTTIDLSTIDESPMAYKPSEEIIALIEPTVTIERIIKPIYNFKAAE